MSEIRTVPQLVIHRAEKDPDHDFLFFSDEKITLGELYKKSASVAGALKEFGVKKDDKVALMLPNAPEFLYAWFGCALLGTTMVPLNTALKGEGLKYIINHSDSKVFIFDEQYFPQIAPQVRELKNISRWISSSGITAVEPDITEYALPRNTISLEKILSSLHAAPCPLSPDIRDADIMAIIYTSGTTGLPKGVMLPQYSYINTGTFYVEDIVGAAKDDIIYTSLPLFHCNAEQFTVMGTLLRGCKMVLAEKFSASNFWDEIRKYNATIFHYIGAIATILYKQPQKENDADNPVRIAMGGACPKEIWRDFEKRFNLKVIEGYGLTETGTCCCHIRSYDSRLSACGHAQAGVGSVGKPARHAQMKIVDDNDSEVPENTPGEIVIKETIPYTMMKGYYKETQKTEEAMRGGWFHSGDRGMKDADGYFYFMDRLKDCIRRRGENISSFEIEKIVNAHPKVLESAAVGVQSELGEDDVKIYVVARDGQKITPEEILAWCEDKMAYFMVPRYVAFRESFPKTETQRVQKFELRKEGVGNAWDREKEGYKLRR